MKVLKFNIFIFTVILSLFISCKEDIKTSNQNIVKNKTDIKQVVTKENNLELIKGLKKLKQVIEDSNNKGFADFFTFPTKRYYYVSPIKVAQSFKDSIITKEYFIKNCYVPNINQDPSLDNLLGRLDLNLLKTKNNIEKKIEIENDECSYFYKIEINNNNSIRLIYESIANPKYEDNEYSCEPESDTIYMKMNDNRLLFNQDKIKMNYEPTAG